mmetsp:Transcript_47995/g.35192  ORF Transcript_47995/g.35192 Transcript_47995/m.35192 type:complete len:118 (+) Transcript_47995:574-927(+)
MILNSISSAAAGMSAGFLNSYIMRKTEIQKGIEVLDDQKSVQGVSRKAAFMAVVKTAQTRALLASTLIFPSVFLWLVERSKLMPQSFKSKTALELTVLTTYGYVAVPPAIGFYPQMI